METNERKDRMPADVEELLRLYRAWFAVLLRVAGQKELHIRADEVASALISDACTVGREEGGYVIRLGNSTEGQGGAAHE